MAYWYVLRRRHCLLIFKLASINAPILTKLTVLIHFISSVFLSYKTSKFWRILYLKSNDRRYRKKAKIYHFHMCIDTHQAYGFR